MPDSSTGPKVPGASVLGARIIDNSEIAGGHRVQGPAFPDLTSRASHEVGPPTVDSITQETDEKRVAKTIARYGGKSALRRRTRLQGI